MELVKHSWKDINLKEYKKILEIVNRKLDSDLEKDIAILAVLLNVEEDTLYDLNIAELKKLLNQMSWIRNEKYTYTNKIKKMNKIVIDGKEYIVNPNINSFSVSQYMDFQNFWEKRNERMGNLLAVFIIPKGCKYNEGYDVIELADKLETVFTLDDWNDVCFFFMKNYQNSIKASIIFSVWQIKKMIWKTKDKIMKEELKNILKQLQQQINNLR